jgi:pyridoxamine 5'-phosphate oxidase-like protein
MIGVACPAPNLEASVDAGLDALATALRSTSNGAGGDAGAARAFLAFHRQACAAPARVSTARRRARRGRTGCARGQLRLDVQHTAARVGPKWPISAGFFVSLAVASALLHVADDGYIVVRARHGGKPASVPARGEPNQVVVAYEADAVDPASHVGWSVVVTGRMDLIVDPDVAARYRALLEPWADEVVDRVLRIHPGLVSGISKRGRAVSPCGDALDS